MTRKAIQRRDTGTDAAQALADYVSSSAPPMTTSDRATLRAAQPGRAELLLAYKPKSAHPAVGDLVKLVADLVLRVEYKSIGSDRMQMKIGFKYALHCVKTYGEFNPSRHLMESTIQQWAHESKTSPNVQSSQLSALRRLRRGKRFEAKFSRNVAQAPYTDDEWAPFERLRISQASPEATTLLTLSGHLGLRPQEVTAATGNWIHVDGGQTWITVPDKDGVIRMIPAFGFNAEWLREQASKGSNHLLRPHREKREMLTEVVGAISRKHGEMTGFRVTFGRHRFVASMLRKRIPLRTIYTVAGLKPGSSLPGDLLAYLDEPSPESVYQTMAWAFGPRPGTPG